jgi:hypothetical protein
VYLALDPLGLIRGPSSAQGTIAVKPSFSIFFADASDQPLLIEINRGRIRTTSLQPAVGNSTVFDERIDSGTPVCFLFIMPASFTPAEVLQLAPDPASAESGRDLAYPRKWVSYAYDYGL